jgi:hypothetical protein
LNPAAPPDPISPRHACLGWWAYCVAAPADTAGQGREAFGVATMVGLVVALGRFAIYAVGIQPPAGFFGRIGSGRWVIPGYDRVLLAPLCITLLTLFAGIGGYLAALNWGVSFAVLSGGTVGLVLLLGIGLGPTLRDWRLCGECTFLRNTRSGLRREPRTSGAGDDSRPGGGFETSWVSVQS